MTTTNRNGITTRDGARGKTYRVNYRNGAGAQRGRSFKSYATAERYKAWRVLNPDAADAVFDAPAAAPSAGATVGQFYAKWAPTRRVSADRRKADDSLFRIQLASLHNRPMAALTPMEVENWLNEISAATKDDKDGNPVPLWAANTIVDSFRVLKKILNAAKRNRALTGDNVTDLVDPPETELVEVTNSDVYTPTELASVLKTVPDRWRALFATLAYTGGRLSEVLALTPALVDLEGTCSMRADCPKRPHIHLGSFRIKENNGRTTRVPGGKTRNSERTVPLIAENVRLLREHYLAYPADFQETLFRTETGAIPNRSNLRQRQWTPACKRAGVRYIPIRNLRHTAATHWLASGMKPVTAAARLGHWSPTVTLTIYARFIPAGDDDTETAAVERYLGL